MKSLLAIVIFLCMVSASGCIKVQHAEDKYPFQPLVKPPKKVECELKSYFRGVFDIGEIAYEKSLVWKTGWFKSYNSEDIIWKYDSFLCDTGFFDWVDHRDRETGRGMEDSLWPATIELEETELPDNDSYPW